MCRDWSYHNLFEINNVSVYESLFASAELRISISGSVSCYGISLYFRTPQLCSLFTRMVCKYLIYVFCVP